jgi:CRISPR/Cas system-associated exonuclease Cas4 (RecB family)
MPDRPIKNTLSAPFTFSQSSLQDYSECNRRFQLRYIEQLQWPAVETAPVLENERRQLEGQQFHRMVHQFLLGLPAEKMAFIAQHAAGENLARWWENFISTRQTTLAGSDSQRLFPEFTLSAPVGGHRVVAKYDLVTVMDGMATIYDWKTYHKRPKDDGMAFRWQTRIYLSLLVKAGASLNNGTPFEPEKVEMQYWYAEFPSEPLRIRYDSVQYQHDWDGLTALIREISAKQSYPLTLDEKKCGYCPFRSYCERGVGAQEGEESEEALDSILEVSLEQIQEIEF